MPRLDISLLLAAADPEPAWSLPLPEAGPLTGVVWLLVALTVAHLLLRALDRAGWISYRGHRLRRGLAGATVALNAIFQPHAREPDQEQKMHMRARAEQQAELGDAKPPPVGFDVEHFPDDGLRGHARRP